MCNSRKLRTACYLVMAGSMAGAMPLAYAASDLQTTPMKQPSGNLALPQGFMQTKLTSASGIKTGLVKLTERAVTKGDFNSFLAELSVQDRERAREFKNPDQSRLDAKIDQISKEWKDKYNQDFEISDKNLVFNDSVMILQGKVQDPNLAIENWPAAAAGGEALQASDRSNSTTADAQKQIDLAKLTKGRDVALVELPAGEGMPAITVSMIFHYPDFWRVDVPNNRTGQQIFNDLCSQLDQMAAHPEEWPNRPDDAYRMVARRAAAALYGVQMPAFAARKS